MMFFASSAEDSSVVLCVTGGKRIFLLRQPDAKKR